MKCLLDTHTYLWAVNNNPRLGRRARDIIDSYDNELLLSIASLWEIAIKLSVGKLQVDSTFLHLAIEQPKMHDVEILHIAIEHLEVVSHLPRHHRDPFDRLLVAQCLAEGMAIVSNDAALDAYGIERLW